MGFSEISTFAQLLPKYFKNKYLITFLQYQSKNSKQNTYVLKLAFNVLDNE